MKVRNKKVNDGCGGIESLYPNFENPIFDALATIVSKDYIKKASFKSATTLVGNSLRDDFSDLDSSFDIS